MAGITVTPTVTNITIINDIVVISIPKIVTPMVTNITIINDIVVISIPKIVTPTVTTINFGFYLLHYSGWITGRIVYPILCFMRGVVSYLPRPINITFVQNIPIEIEFKMDEFLNTNIRVILSVIPLTVTCNYFASLFSDKKPRVIRIGTLEVAPSMYFSENNKDYLSSARTTVAGKDILFSERAGKFLKKETIESDSDFWYSQDFLRRLGLLIAQNKEVTLYFNNGYRVQARFDILNNPLSATPTYLGSDNYYVTIKVLL